MKIRAVTWLVIPALVILLALVLYPTVYLWGMVFYSYHPARDPYPSFVGLKNFGILVGDSEASYTILAMLALVGITIPTQLVLGSLLAIVFTARNTRGKLGLRVLLLIPMMIPAVIIGLNWRMIFFSEGPINGLLSSLGISPQPWLSEPFGNAYLTLFSLAILDIWQWTPFITIAVMSGIESAPKEVYEAASLDGASEIQTLWHIVLPMIKGIIVIVLLLRIIDSMKIFDIIYTLTNGGPGIITTTFPFQIYKTGFTLTSTHPDIGYASLLALILLAISSCIAMIIMKLFHIEKLIWE
jgi:multiple sugar transport system permease protein